MKWEILSIDPITKTAIIVIENTEFIRQCWVFSQVKGVRVNRNFLDLLPGKHEINIQFEEIPTKSDFEFIWL